MESRDCHSQLSDELKAQGGSNDVLSHAVYHQILAGESFRDIPMWPDKHEDWVYDYQDFDYAAIFKPALDAAKESWDEGYEEGGTRHDFAVGWTETVTRNDYRIKDYRNRTGQFMGIKRYLGWPVLILVILTLIEKFIASRGQFPRLRFFY